MPNDFRKFVQFADKIWFVDLSGEEWVVDIVLPDGSTRPAIGTDGNFLDMLNEGQTIAQPAHFEPTTHLKIP